MTTYWTKIKDAPLHVRLFVGFALVLLASASQSVFAYQTTIDNLVAADWVDHTQTVLSLTEQTRTALLEMAAAYRGFLLTGDEAFWKSYTAAAESYTIDLAALEQLTVDNPPQVARWQELEQRRAAWQREVIEPGSAMRRAAVETAASGQDARVANVELGQQHIDGIQHLIDEATGVEGVLLQQRQVVTSATNDRLVEELEWGTLAVLSLGLAIAVLFAWNLARATTRVLASERRYRQMFENNPSIKLVIEPISGAIVEANQAACEFYGYSRADMLRRHVWDLNTLPAAAILEILARMVKAERTSFTTCHRLASGALRDVEVQASTIIDEDLSGGTLLYAVMGDLTQRNQAEARLRVQTSLLEAQGEASPDGIVALAPDGRILSFNGRFAELWRLPTPLLAGGSFDATLGALVAQLADPQAFLTRVATPQVDSEVRGQAELALRDGRTFDFHSAPVHGVDGAHYGRVWFFRDISERILAEAEAHKTQAFLAAVLESVGAGIVACDADGVLTIFNEATRTFHGLPEQPLFPEQWAEHYTLYEADGTTPMPTERIPLARALRGEQVRNAEMMIVPKCGPARTLVAEGRALRDRQGRPLGAVVAMHDISERRRAEEALRHQALHDGLTDLPNRTLLHDRLSLAILAGQRENAPVALLLIDLDRFKEINDTFGHPIGDLLLQQIGPRIMGALRASDSIARLGGDEFCILLPGTDAASAVAVAQHLLRRLESPFDLGGQSIEIAASVGIAAYPAHGSDAATLLRQADVAMYVAKRNGSGVVVYTPDDDHHSAELLSLSGELRRALARSELLLHFQPKLNLRDGTLAGVEALVRWQHPQRGFLPPYEFITLAEQTGLIQPLTQWVLDATLQQQQAWRAMGLDVRVAVNLSRRTLHDPDLPQMVAQLLTRWDAAPAGLVLEITESSLMAEPVQAKENLARLRALGVCISIDDFGTGYSSLASLKNLPVDELKIDQSFVIAMATDASARAIVRAIIDLADALKLRVVAEGVEDRATWDVLAGLGCDIAQGYFMSRPIAAAELQTWIAQLSPSWLEIAAQSDREVTLQTRIRERGARLAAEDEFVARKQAEADLRASESLNRLALDAAGMGTWAWDVASDVRAWSTETEVLFGLVPGAFDGTSTAFRRSIHPDDWPALKIEQGAAIAEHRDSITTCRVVWPDGTIRWVESKGRGVNAADGTLTSVIGTCLDITERKLAQDALVANEERFRRQYKTFPLPTYSWLQVGDDFVLQDYNDAAEATAESDLREWIGNRASERYAHQPEILVDLHACVRQQPTVPREFHYHFPSSGRERDLVLSYVFVPPQTVMLHSEDVTERREAHRQREAMARSEKLRALGQMASGIAHDLNQSLMLVASYSELARQALVQEPPNVAEAEDLLTTTTQAALNGGGTVKQLLLFTRTAPEQDSQLVDLSTLVRDAAQLTSPRWRDAAQAEGRPISLYIETEGQPTIQGSAARLCELMTNLIFNAVDALPAGGTIRLRVVAEEDGLGSIEVADSGVGMSAEVQARVFEPFFTTKGEGGTGLGLAMVFGIVEQHGGNIEVRSAPGDGTTFRMTFPLVEASAKAEESADAETTTQATEQLEPPRALRVLVVDDEPMMTKAVVRILKPAGHAVSVANSGEEAFETLSKQTFDVVVSDMGMGAGMNGWELADAVKTRWPSVRFLLATGWGAALDPGEVRTSGVEAVLSKPYHPADLLQALARPGMAA